MNSSTINVAKTTEFILYDSHSYEAATHASTTAA